MAVCANPEERRAGVPALLSHKPKVERAAEPTWLWAGLGSSAACVQPCLQNGEEEALPEAFIWRDPQNLQSLRVSQFSKNFFHLDDHLPVLSPDSHWHLTAFSICRFSELASKAMYLFICFVFVAVAQDLMGFREQKHVSNFNLVAPEWSSCHTRPTRSAPRGRAATQGRGQEVRLRGQARARREGPPIGGQSGCGHGALGSWDGAAEGCFPRILHGHEFSQPSRAIGSSWEG